MVDHRDHRNGITCCPIWFESVEESPRRPGGRMPDKKGPTVRRGGRLWGRASMFGKINTYLNEIIPFSLFMSQEAVKGRLVNLPTSFRSLLFG